MSLTVPMVNNSSSLIWIPSCTHLRSNSGVVIFLSVARSFFYSPPASAHSSPKARWSQEAPNKWKRFRTGQAIHLAYREHSADPRVSPWCSWYPRTVPAKKNPMRNFQDHSHQCSSAGHEDPCRYPCGTYSIMISSVSQIVVGCLYYFQDHWIQIIGTTSLQRKNKLPMLLRISSFRF